MKEDMYSLKDIAVRIRSISYFVYLVSPTDTVQWDMYNSPAVEFKGGTPFYRRLSSSFAIAEFQIASYHAKTLQN